LSHTQQTLEATYASLQQAELLAGLTNEQDLQTHARSLLQIMQASFQPHPAEDVACLLPPDAQCRHNH